MRLSRRVSLLGRQGNRRLSSQRTRKKHKKLDDICENVYSLNHTSVNTENNVEEGEPRRSTRVRRAPDVLDASPSPAKKRRRVEVRSESGSLGKGKRRERVKVETRNVERESGSLADRLRARGKKAEMSTRSSLRKAKRKLFKVACSDSSDDLGGESSMSKVVKPKRPGRIKASNDLKIAVKERELYSDDEESSESNEDAEDNEVNVQEREFYSDDEESSESNENAEDNKVKNEASDHEGNDEVDNVHSSQSDEDEESDEVEEEESSESNEGGEDGENNEIGIHVGKKEAHDGGKDDETDTRDSSESDEEGEHAKEHEFKEGEDKNEVGHDEVNEEMDILEDIEKDNFEETKHKKTDEVAALLQSEDIGVPNNLETTEQDALVELEKSIADRENQMEFHTVGGVSTEQIEIVRSNEKSLDDEIVIKTSHDTNERRYLRVGRRCGLCGTGVDGKPPKTLVEYGIGSDREVAYSGSSAAEDIRYDTSDGFGVDSGWLGRLLGPINDRHGIAGIFVHQNCAVWSPEVYFAGLSRLKNVRAALFRGRVLKCTRCSRPGATIGCRVDRCPKTYHLPCARANGCIFYHKKFLIACTDHRHLFQPHGVQDRHRIKKIKTKKLKLEMRKVSGDAWRKDLEAEEKYLENCGEDEEFLKRESKRLHRDLIRIAPVYIGGPSSDKDSQFQGWESVAGLQNVIQSLKEVVILPLLYPEFFSDMSLTPPRGVLLHGHPGTGKTLVVRALIGSCAQGDKRIAYFARKGADCLGKYVGDAERQLRLLFQVAEKSQPSIIFFDEIDGLAPSRTRHSDQTHNSVVSTLLALMDGLKSRGSVVVIGATNRPDSVDPALRRPGRFDREIYFPLPSEQDREAILSLHTRKWPKPVTGLLLKQIARQTVGFAGADLQSLCTQAAITALRRSCPFQEILSAAEKNGPSGKHPPLPTFVVEERDWLEALRRAPPPCSQRGTEMAANDVVSTPLRTHLIPCLLQPLSIFLASLSRDKRIFLPCPLYKAVALVKSVVVFALSRKKISSDNWWPHAHEMLLEADVLRDVEIKLSHCGIVKGQTSYSSSNADNEEADDIIVESPCSKEQQISPCPRLWKNATCGSERKIGFWLLISGNPRSGQRYLASCLLHCFTGNVEIQKLDSATISQEGQGDLMLGVTRILMKCASVGSSLIFMPRIDLWAIETFIQDDREERDSSSKNLPVEEEQEVPEKVNSEDILQKTSPLWDIFVEQVESISVSSSLTILATSALPSEALPDGINQFFKSGKSNNRCSSSFEETIPRFSVPLDGHFNNYSVINSSATELSKDLVQLFVQLTHQRIHVHSSPNTCVNYSDTLEGDADNHSPANEVAKEQLRDSSFTQVSTPVNSRPKGKSNLLLTIATLGYQILRYPHFAELCWVTSKLKDGPCTDTRGPWKGWPFNSCIVRSGKSSEHVAVTCSSSNIKSREICGLVRGLIAVGLSAYRGMYTTVLEVSSEVRKVLELLADQINTKIRAGKDPSHFIRLLSQMAYFEDVVNSWAYSLQSLEENAQAIPPSLTNLKSRDYNPFEDTADAKGGDELDVSVKNSEDTTEQKDGGKPAKIFNQMLEESTQNLDLNEAIAEDNQNSDPCTLETPCNHQSDNRVCGSILPNGFANTDAVANSEDGLCSGEIIKENPSTSEVPSSQQNDKTMEANIKFQNGNSSSINERNNVESTSLSGNANSLSNEAGINCFYRCCSECLIKLHETIMKVITYEWELRDDGNFTVEDVHDLVASVSMNLQSSLRKLSAAERDKGEEEMRQDNIRGASKKLKKDVCQCKDSEDRSKRPKECRFHSTLNPKLQLENELKFVCRDGVTSQMNQEEVTSLNFHCKFEILCLSSLIESIVMTKQPSG